MIRIRKSSERGFMRNDWLEARFSFSFGPYRDPAFDGYSDLLIFNDDRVAPGAGFRAHPHRDIEAISYVLEGEVEHRDSLGNVARIRAGDAHRMTAGRGIAHSEMNASAERPEHHLQLWLRPHRRGLEPDYEQRSFPDAAKRGQLRLIASPDGREGSLTVHQDANLYAAIVEADGVTYVPRQGRHTYLHLARGAVHVNGHRLAAGDGAFIEDEAAVHITGDPGGELLLLDLR